MLILLQWLIKQFQTKNLILEKLVDRLNKPFFYNLVVESGQYQLDVITWDRPCRFRGE